MKNISEWPWKGIWQALGVLAILLSMAYSPYLLLSSRLDRMDRRFEAMERNIDRRFEAMERTMNSRFEAMDRKMDRRFESIDDKLANIDKRLAVVEDRVGVTASHIPVRSDSALATRAGPPPAAVSVLDAEPIPVSGRLSRRFALAGARLLCDIMPVVPGSALLKAGYAQSCRSCAIGANA